MQAEGRGSLGLQDVARLLSHYSSTQKGLITVIRALGTERLTFEQLRKKTGMKVRYLRYMITILRGHGIVRGERSDAYRYRLSPEAFAEHVKIKYAKTIENMAKGKVQGL